MSFRAAVLSILLVLLGAVLALAGRGPLRAASTHAQEEQRAAVSGIIYFDRNRNGERDPGEPLLARTGIGVVQIDGRYSSGGRGGGSYDGTYRFLLPAPDTYRIGASLREIFSDNGIVRSRPVLAATVMTITVSGNLSGVDLGLALPPTPRDERYFPETGYRIDSDPIWNYFQARGGVRTFGYPISRAFPLFEFWTQMFQRNMINLVGGLGPHQMNLLDPHIMPVTSVNFSTIPPHDAALAGSAPPWWSRANYGEAVLQHLRATVPDVWEGQAVRFLETYLADARAGPHDFSPLVALEMWGFPTSHPMRDPNNHNFVYQRFQRAVLHYDATTGTTQALLLGEAFKSVVTGEDLSEELAVQMANSPYLRLYDPTQVNAVARVPAPALAPPGSTWARLSANLAFAFVPD